MPWSGAAELLASCLQSRDPRVAEGREVETFGVPDAAREGVLITDICLPAFGSRADGILISVHSPALQCATLFLVLVAMFYYKRQVGRELF